MRTLLGQSVPNIITNSDFPKGTPKDDSPLGSKTGTPITEKAGIADCYNALLAVIAEAGLTPNEQAEKQVGGSQFLDALIALSEKEYTFRVRFWESNTYLPFGDTYIVKGYKSGKIMTIFLEGIGPDPVPGTGLKPIGLVFVDEDGIPLTTFPDEIAPSQRHSGTPMGVYVTGSITYQVIYGAFPAYIYDKLSVYFFDNSDNFSQGSLEVNGGDTVSILYQGSISYVVA